MDNKVKYVCKCGTELPSNHTGPCPNCGAIGKIHRAYEATGNAIIGLKTSGSGTHKPKWSGVSLTLFFGLTAPPLAVVIWGILTLLPFSLGINYGILIGFLLVIGSTLWYKRYSVLMLIRRLEGKSGGEKKM